MLCQHCSKNDASIRMNIHINNRMTTLSLCQECLIKAGENFSSNGGSGFDMGLGSFGQVPVFTDWFKGDASDQSPTQPMNDGLQGKPVRGGGILDELGTNLTDSAKAGLIDPVVGRDNEVQRVIEILNRRNKNNPVLIGEPGVGKTAIAEGLADRIAQGQVPAKLMNKQVYTLDVSSLVAGTGIRGQFEEKMKKLISELKQRNDVILFIDEIHLLVGAGSAEGSMDAGNILKPALARGELQLVGATTLKEYRRIEKDAALERRFQPVTVKEPSLDEAYEILRGLRPKYEEYHQVHFSDDVLRACVHLSHRYIQDRFLPDKAIDLLDESGSKINLLASVYPDKDAIRQQLVNVAADKQQATLEEDYERAAKLRDQEISLRDKLSSPGGGQQRAEVSVEDLQKIVEQKTGIPVSKLQKDEQEKLKGLEGYLGSKVIGQKEAVEKVAKAIRRSRTGFKPKNRPIASFLFIGPTGVGKTELTKVLAEQLFGSKDALIRSRYE